MWHDQFYTFDPWTCSLDCGRLLTSLISTLLGLQRGWYQTRRNVHLRMMGATQSKYSMIYRRKPVRLFLWNVYNKELFHSCAACGDMMLVAACMLLLLARTHCYALYKRC